MSSIMLLELNKLFLYDISHTIKQTPIKSINMMCIKWVDDDGESIYHHLQNVAEWMNEMGKKAC